jgi:hypothetical protein
MKFWTLLRRISTAIFIGMLLLYWLGGPTEPSNGSPDQPRDVPDFLH